MSEPSPSPFPAAEARHLDRDQRAVIERSRRHSLASVDASAPWWQRTRRLADPRREALRRYVVLLRRGGDDWASEAANTLVRLGYTIDQVAHARWLVACEVPPAPRTVSPTTLVLLAKATLLAGLIAVNASPVWPLGLVLAAALIRPKSLPRSRWSAWERNFTVV